MYPVLILRAEVVSLVLLLFLFFTSRSYNIEKEKKPYRRIVLFAIIHVCFDIITVLTVNNTDTLPMWVNWVCHVIFYLSAILFSNEIASYAITVCYPIHARKFYAVGHGLALAYVIALPFLKIDYVETVGTYSSSGPAAYVGYGLAFLMFVFALTVLFVNLKTLPAALKKALIPIMILIIVMELSQIIWKSLLFTGCAVTIVTVGFFFSLENPVEVFKRKAMTDALTGVRSRSSYESDIEALDKKFQSKPGTEYIFVFCDLNDLRNVNNRYGHPEGDNYIINIASAINHCMKNASSIYRIGGDEFLVFYYRTDESVVVEEIKDLNDRCAKISEGKDYVSAVSVGYAKSSDSYKSLKDVVKTADYAMYRNKNNIKKNIASESDALGTRLNYAGLTDKIFDAMCSSNDKNYPYITNLETNVTRISPKWSEFFGLDGEFFSDFNSIWEQRIHPDYIKGYEDDIAAVINGHAKYHNFEYLAKKADGEYVPVSCHGSIYHDNGDNCSYFVGFMVNHGADDGIDPVTGLRNFDKLTSEVCTHIDDSKPFSILKFRINDFSRVNMLYGYSGGDEIVTRIAEMLSEEINGIGEVFCQTAVNFSCLFEGNDRQTVEDFYKKMSVKMAAGIQTQKGSIPLVVSGGAYLSNGEHIKVQDIRRNLVYAVEESRYSSANKLVFYNNEGKTTQADVTLLTAIHADAVGDMKYFDLRYQPIVDISSKKTVGAEALLRWIHPDYGEVLPDRFIAFLEKDPSYYRLGLEIIDKAVRDAKEFQKSIPEFRINVNITALQLQNETFADSIMEILRKYDFEPEFLALELTERCKEMDGSLLAKRIQEIRSKGITVAFDDLGTGYSTINLLMDIPIDEIKLDRMFVRDLQNRESYQLFVRSLVLENSFSEYNYKICFEGIENEEMLNFVSQFGQYLAQGYFFAKPLPYQEFVSHLAENNAPEPVNAGK